MQRYDPIDLGNGCLPHELMEHSLGGKYVLAEEAQAEIDALHAECDRLTALLENPNHPEDNRITDAVRAARGGDAPTPKRGFS